MISEPIPQEDITVLNEDITHLITVYTHMKQQLKNHNRSIILMEVVTVMILLVMSLQTNTISGIYGKCYYDNLHTQLESKKYHDLSSAICKPKKVNGVVLV